MNKIALAVLALFLLLPSCNLGPDYTADVVGHVQSWAPVVINRPYGLAGPTQAISVPQTRKTMLHD